MAEDPVLPDRMLTSGRPTYPFDNSGESLWRRFPARVLKGGQISEDSIDEIPGSSFNRSRPGNEPPGHYTDVLRECPEWGVFELTVDALTLEQPSHDASQTYRFAPVHRPEDRNYYHTQFEYRDPEISRPPSKSIRRLIRARLLDKAQILRYPSDEPVAFPD